MGLLEVASLCHPKIRPKVRITWAIKAGRFEFEVRPASITTRACPDDLSLNAAQGALDPPGFSPALRTRARALHRLKPAQLPLWPCGRLVTHGDLTEQAATCRNPTEVADTKQAGEGADQRPAKLSSSDCRKAEEQQQNRDRSCQKVKFSHFPPLERQSCSHSLLPAARRSGPSITLDPQRVPRGGRYRVGLGYRPKLSEKTQAAGRRPSNWKGGCQLVRLS